MITELIIDSGCIEIGYGEGIRQEEEDWGILSGFGEG